VDQRYGGKLKTHDRLQQAIIENGGVECEQAPDAFFLEEEYKDPNKRYKTDVAKKICGDCPVRLLCLEYALEQKEVYGIWGGLTRAERQRLVNGRRYDAVLYSGDSRGPDRERVRLAG